MHGLLKWSRLLNVRYNEISFEDMNCSYVDNISLNALLFLPLKDPS